MIYAVIDTNVLVSALITHNSLSATAKVVRLASLWSGFLLKASSTAMVLPIA